MGKQAARFVQGRMLMFGADRGLPVTLVENASRPDQQTIATTLLGLPEAADQLNGPAVILLSALCIGAISFYGISRARHQEILEAIRRGSS